MRKRLLKILCYEARQKCKLMLSFVLLISILVSQCGIVIVSHFCSLTGDVHEDVVIESIAFCLNEDDSCCDGHEEHCDCDDEALLQTVISEGDGCCHRYSNFICSDIIGDIVLCNGSLVKPVLLDLLVLKTFVFSDYDISGIKDDVSSPSFAVRTSNKSCALLCVMRC
ncbi:MAG: hypothetical protein HUJ96_00490 [Marinilabiliaceae bacterium]|nr:hypothetical protein [Marinilabiliaceae bacterium]